MSTSFKLLADVKSALESAGFKTFQLDAGASPYSSFDLIAFKGEVKIGETPCKYAVSPHEMVSSDPATAYKGRVARGRAIVATADPNGWIKVGSSTGDTVHLTLADGTPLGVKASLTLGDLFPDLGVES